MYGRAALAYFFTRVVSLALSLSIFPSRPFTRPGPFSYPIHLLVRLFETWGTWVITDPVGSINCER